MNRYRPDDQKQPDDQQAPAQEVRRGQYAAAVSLLYGSNGYFVNVIISFAVAVGAVMFGIYTADIPPAARNLGSMATFFLISTTFTLAKTVRDSFVADLGVPGHQIIRGTIGWRIQCWAFFIVSVYHSFSSVHSLDIGYETKYFIYTGLLFSLNASINLAKQIRDRSDAEFWQAREGSIDNLRKVRTLAAGTLAHTLQTWLVFMSALFIFLKGTMTFKMALERKGFLVMGLLFTLASSFNLAKAVRDSAANVENLQPRALHWLLYIGAFIVALGMTSGGLYLMPLPLPQKVYLALCYLFNISITFGLAKLVRDKQEMGAAVNHRND